MPIAPTYSSEELSDLLMIVTLLKRCADECGWHTLEKHQSLTLEDDGLLVVKWSSESDRMDRETFAVAD